jgi:hypothetical protein
MTGPRTPADIKAHKRRRFAALRGLLRTEVMTVANDLYPRRRISNDERGQGVVFAMIATGVYDRIVRRWAPWSKDEIDTMKTIIDAKPVGYWDGRRLGKTKIRLEDARRTRLGLRMLHPHDKRWEDVQQERDDRRRTNEKERRRIKQRSRQMQMGAALIDSTGRDERRRSLLMMIEVVTTKREFWTGVPTKALAERLHGAPAWLDGRGRPLEGPSLLGAIRRVADDLVTEGAIAVSIEHLTNKRPVWFLRLAEPEKAAENHRIIESLNHRMRPT